MSDEPNIQEVIRRNRPNRIDDLWMQHQLDDEPVPNNGLHLTAENLDWWATELEITEFLRDERRCKDLLRKLNESALLLGMQLQEMGQQHFVLVSNCIGCNNVHDAGALTSHCSHSSRTFLPLPPSNVPFALALHRTSSLRYAASC